MNLVSELREREARGQKTHVALFDVRVLCDWVKMTDKPACVIDNGTGFTKMGYSGNMEPNFIVPSLISTIAEGKSDKKKDIEDLNFFIGAEANNTRLNYNIDAPIRHGLSHIWHIYFIEFS